MKQIIFSLAFLATVSGASSDSPAQQIERNADSTVRVVPVPMDEKLKNPVTPEYEQAFWKRANAQIHAMTHKPDGSWTKVDNRTFFEGEKWSYPGAMLRILAGDVQPGLKVLQQEDDQAQGDNKHTLGIDFFPAFTLKGQMRKYFFFGSMLAPEYRARMKEAMGIWTKTDPRSTPHPIYQEFNPAVEGWNANRFGNRQVDSRNTDNLRAMRDIAIYLFAEETGNTAIMEAARKDILFYVNSLYTIGMGEWDSDTYLCHGVAPYLCLYDFAKDPAMQSAAKAALDFFFTSAALKYHNGVFSGPEKRDYGWGYRPMGSPFSKFFALYFGQTAMINEATELDLAHAITSNYRPPQAVLALAEKQFARPVELLGTKPVYENWKEGQRERPGYFETLYFGKTFQVGSIVSLGGDNDTGPFRLSADHSTRGADVVNFSSRLKLNEKFPGDQIGQYRNLVLWLRPTDSANQFAMFLPADAMRTVQNGVTFVKLEKTWLAIRPINLGEFQPAKMDEKQAKHYPGHVLLSADCGSGKYSGLAIEVGEAPMTFEAFCSSVLEKGKLDLSNVDQGKARLTSTSGPFLEMTHQPSNDLPILNRNGEIRDWNDASQFALWQTMGETPVVSLGWKTGTLRVEAGGKIFQTTWRADGNAEFSNR